MRPGFSGLSARSVCPWFCLVIMFALIVGGCSKGAPLSKNAEALKKQLLSEMNILTAALVAPVAQQDWQAVEPILQAKVAELKNRGDVAPASIVVVDQNAISQARFPAGEHRQGLDFMNYQPAQVVFTEKKKTQAQLFVGDKKIYVCIAPILQQDQVIGAVAMGFPEEDLKIWKVSEQEFLNIDFNQ